MAATAPDPWSIAVKTVGGGLSPSGSQSGEDACGERNFTVTVSPDDCIASLHDQIEGATGLKASQQRLIFRGRLIGKSDQSDAAETGDIVKEPKIKDIVGLSDGQTIHLVKKRDPTPERSNQAEESSSTESTTQNSSTADLEAAASVNGNGSASLLAALLGLGGLEDGDNGNTERPTLPSSRQRWGGWRSSRVGRSRRPHYRLTSEDLEVPDPGSMEPVRQGLMTLHTILPHARVEELTSPLEANREWYRGQWIDCRDTVNQWLEATIVEIVKPEELFPRRGSARGRARNGPRRRRPHVANDPAVSATDLDGRRRLLLEPCESGDSDDEGGELAGFRQRDTNEGVQLLMIHYNGWPHRWDEWIRSDSERIRPFRTRTRHPNTASTVSPTPQSVFNESPRTNIRGTDEVSDRAHLLPELNRALALVNELVSEAIEGSSTNSEVDEPQEDLPWIQWNEDENSSNGSLPGLLSGAGNVDEPSGCELLTSTSAANNRRQSNMQRRQLELLAPILDRLGRTLTDAAPHVASLAASLPDDGPAENEDDSVPDDLPDLVGDSHASIGGLLSLLSRDRRRRSFSDEPNFESGGSRSSNVDPDHVDYATGLVNTYRGEVRSGPRSRSQQDDVAGLLGAYLAAASLGSLAGVDDSDGNDENGNTMQGLSRLLRDRGSGGGGGNGGGIDIHIHAVVTAPGVTPPGGLGFATLGVGGGGGGGAVVPTATAGARNLFSSARDRGRASGSLLRSRNHAIPSSSSATDDDDMGLFSDLYSENPMPVNPNEVPEPGEAVEHNHDGGEDGAEEESDFLARMSGPGLGQAIAIRSDSLTLSPSRRSRRSPRRDNSDRERQRGWGRLFRRRSRSNHHRSNDSSV